MDCPAEEQLVRIALSGLPGPPDVDVDLHERTVGVTHAGSDDEVLAALEPLGLGAALIESGPARDHDPRAGCQRRALISVLGINAAMFVAELGIGLWAQSTGLIADSLDMLADASIYGIALAAVGGSAAAQRRAARLSGWLQLGLAGLVLLDVARRLTVGSEPQSAVMMVMGLLALVANTSCVLIIAAHRGAGLHMRASWIFSLNDTLANLGVIVAGLLVALTGSPLPDLVVGSAVAILVAAGAWRILRLAPSPGSADTGAG